MNLHNLKPAAGSVHKEGKRVGRGEGSGKGGTAARGNKGAGSRSGTSTKRGFEGGQMPLYRRLPKIGFKSLNTGKARIQGVEFSVMGGGNIGDHEFQLLAGYTYTNPITLTPEYNYGLAEEGSNLVTASNYLSTSSDTTNYILKYRLQHLVRGDILWKYKQWFPMLCKSAKLLSLPI
jgi:hypothetical protein